MKERLSTRRPRAGLLLALGVTAGLLTGSTAPTVDGATSRPVPVEAGADANHARDAIASLYEGCEITDMQAGVQNKNPLFSKRAGYETLRMTVQLDINPEGAHYREVYDKDNAVRWGDQSVRLGMYRRDGQGGFKQVMPMTFRPENLPTVGGEQQFDVYPTLRAPEGMVYVPYVGNTAETKDGEVSAATPCGAIEKGPDGWHIIKDGPEVTALPPEHTEHMPVIAGF